MSLISRAPRPFCTLRNSFCRDRREQFPRWCARLVGGNLPASAVRCRICTTRCHTRRRQGRGASRTRGGLPQTVSPSPHHERMGVYRRPHQPGHLSYDPSVAFPTRRTGRLCDREIPHGVSGVTGKGTVGDRSRVASRESPTLPSVSSAHTVLRGRRDPRLPPLPIGPICPQSSGDTRPVVLQESAAAQEIVAGAVCRSCCENGGKRSARWCP